MEKCVPELLKTNRSYRRFTEKQISMEQMSALIEAARVVPSAGNLQQLRFVPVVGEQCKKVYPTLGWAGYLRDWDGPDASERPTAYMIVLCPVDGAKKYLVGVDVGIAAQSMLLTATEMGLGGCMLANIDRKALTDALGLDTSAYEIALVVALGEPLEQVRIVPMQDGNVKYYRDEAGVHYVPKRAAEELTVLPKA